MVCDLFCGFQLDYSSLKVKWMLNIFDESGSNPANTIPLYHNKPWKLCRISLRNLTVSFSGFHTQPRTQTWGWVCKPADFQQALASRETEGFLFLLCYTKIGIMSLSQNDEHQANFQCVSTAIALKPDELYYAYLLLNYPCRCLRCPKTAKAVLALKSTQSDLRLEMTALQGAGPGERTRSLFNQKLKCTSVSKFS